jgi:hypothetical protein
MALLIMNAKALKNILLRENQWHLNLLRNLFLSFLHYGEPLFNQF